MFAKGIESSVSMVLRCYLVCCLGFMVAKISVIFLDVSVVKKSKSLFTYTWNGKWVNLALTILELFFSGIVVKRSLKCWAVCFALVLTVLLIIKLVGEDEFLFFYW